MPGTYTLRPIQATLTHDTDWLGKMDPYCSYRVGADRIKGPVCRNGGKFPKWEDATVNIPATNEPSLVVDLLDKDKIFFDGNIGSFVVDLYEIQSKGQVSKWYPVYFEKKPAGEILLEAAFQPAPVMVQPVVQVEPVIVKKTIVEEPIIVKKTIVEEVPVVQKEIITEKQFVTGGPVILGASHIHHGGEGHGLVPNHGPILTQGSNVPMGNFTQGSHIQQGTLNQGLISSQHSTLNQGTHFNQGINQGLNQGTHFNQGVNQGTHLNQGINQGLNQGTTFNQGGNLNQGQF